MNHRFGANCKSNNGAFNLTFIDLTMQVSYLTKQKLCEHPTPCEGYQILYGTFSQNQIKFFLNVFVVRRGLFRVIFLP